MWSTSKAIGHVGIWLAGKARLMDEQIERVRVVDVDPRRDTIVIESKVFLSCEAVRHIMSQVEELWPGVRTLVLDRDLSLTVLREGDLPATHDTVTRS